MYDRLSQFWDRVQGSLFPQLEEELPPLTQKQQQAIAILEMIRIEQAVGRFSCWRGRPQKSRAALARTFVIRAVYNMPTTRMLIERMHSDISLRRICGWEQRSHIPDESTFSRVFAEFAESKLPKLVDDTLISNLYETWTLYI